jgi:MFS family permease
VVVSAATASLSLYLFSGTLPLYLHRDRGYSLPAVGLVVGIAFVVQLVATLFSGPLIDRRGARLALRLGPALYLGAACLFLISAAPAAIVSARVLQGLGIALILPGAYAVVPSLIPPRFRGTALAAFGAVQNLALAAGPPLGLWLLRRGAAVLFGVAALAALTGALLSLLLRVGRGARTEGPVFTYRGAWTPLLTLTFLTVVYWGVVTAFLPLHVPRQLIPAVGWFFTADALGILAFRIPIGFLSDRFGSRWLLLAGILVTVLAIGLLLLPASDLTLILAGAGTGAGAALLIPPTLVELQKRSDDSDRGTAMALFTTSFAAAIGVGSLVAAPLVAEAGFEAALLASAALCLFAAPLALGLRPAPESPSADG